MFSLHLPLSATALALKHRSDRDTHHQIFVTEHSKKRSDADLPVGRTLFCLNVPPYVQADHLAAGFADASGGDVAHVVLADRCGVRLQAPAVAASAASPQQSSHFSAPPVGLNQFKSAYVVFRSTKALHSILADGCSEVRLYRSNKTLLDTGLARWTRDYLAAQPDEGALEAEVNEYMAAFERTEEEQRAAERRQKAEAEVDDEGWQTVGKGRGAGFEQKESTLHRLEEKIEAGKKRKELLNFYTFQIRDSKKQHVVGLRKRFEEDKRKIESMKQARQFRPY